LYLEFSLRNLKWETWGFRKGFGVLRFGIQVIEIETLGKLWNLERELERSNKKSECFCGDPKP
jgi:hypothetical protein